MDHNFRWCVSLAKLSDTQKQLLINWLPENLKKYQKYDTYFHYPNYTTHKGFLDMSHMALNISKQYQEINGDEMTDLILGDFGLKTNVTPIGYVRHNTEPIIAYKTPFDFGELKAGFVIMVSSFKDGLYVGHGYTIPQKLIEQTFTPLTKSDISAYDIYTSGKGWTKETFNKMFELK